MKNKSSNKKAGWKKNEAFFKINCSTHIYTEGRRAVTHRLLRNRQGITNVQCFALNKLICQELEEFSMFCGMLFFLLLLVFFFWKEGCFHRILYVCITSHLNQCQTLSLGNYFLCYLSRVRSKFQAVLNCYFVVIIFPF